MRKPKIYKNIDLDVKTYYCFELINGNNIIYDYNMRNPIEYGSLVVTDGFLSKIDNSYHIIYYKNSNTRGFEKTNRKKPEFNVDIAIKESNGSDITTAWTVLDPKQLIYYYIELENGKVVLFDSEMGNPVIINSNIKGYSNRQTVSAIVSNLNKKCIIYYFKQVNKELVFRNVYTPTKETKDSNSTKIKTKQQELKNKKS